MADPDILFSPELFRTLEDVAIMSFISSVVPKDQAEPVLALLRAFSRRGVPVKTVLEVFKEVMPEGGLTDG